MEANMETANITIRTDKELKRQVEAVLNDMGLNMTSAMTMYLKKIAREKRIPFEIAIDPFYSHENQEHLKAAIKRFDAGKFKKQDLIEG